MKRWILIPVVSAAFAVLVWFAVLRIRDRGAADNGPAPTIEGLVSSMLRGFDLRESHQRRDVTMYTYVRQHEILKLTVIQNIEKEAAQILLEDGMISLEAIYAGTLSPYPGDISRRIAPNKRLRPKFAHRTIDGVKYTYFLLYANDRLGYGGLSQDSIRYKSLLGWFHCERTSRFYKIRYFAPRDAANEQLEAFLLSMRCQNQEA